MSRRLPYAALPAATIVATKRALLDGIGVILAASGISDEAQPFVALARRQPAEPSATVLGHGLRAAPAAAALANGAMSHALDYEDAFDLAPVHPNASLIPAALAAAEAHGPVSGEDVHCGDGDRLRPRLPARAQPAPADGGRRLVPAADPRRVRRNRGGGAADAIVAAAGD